MVTLLLEHKKATPSGQHNIQFFFANAGAEYQQCTYSDIMLTSASGPFQKKQGTYSKGIDISLFERSF